MRSHLLVFAALGLAIVGCSKEPKKTAWNCQQLGVPGGETLSCTKQAVTTDGTSPSITSDGYVPPMPTGLDEETCEGSLDNPDICTPDGLATGGGAGGSATNTGSTDSTSSTGTSGGGAGSVYYCSAGSTDCPPVSAVIGINSDSTSSEGSTGGGAGSGSGSGSGSGDSKGPVGSDGTDSKGGESGGGGGDGDGDKDGDKDDAKPGEGGGAGSGTGGSSVGTDGTSSTGGKSSGAGSETYRCEKKKNGRIDCTKTEPKCEEGLTPSGGYCSTGGTSDSTTSSGTSTSGTDGSTTTPDSTPKTTTSNGKSFDLKEVTTHPDGTKTWTYEVCEISGHDLSNWVLGTGSCQVVSATPSQGFEKVSSDPNSGLSGVKWNTGTIKGCVTYSVTTVGGTQTLIPVSAKASTGVSYGYVTGPKCD